MKFRDQAYRKRFLQMMAGIVGMGIFLSFIIGVNYGTDTSSFMNLALSQRLGISFGTCVLAVNVILFIPEVIFERRLINVGTIANMTLIGYIADFCRMLEKRFLPELLFTQQPWRTLVFILALLPFLVSVALYMNADLGQTPFDAVSTMITHRFHLPYFLVRIGWDFLVILVGVLAGRKLTIATVVFALTIGPAVSFIGRWLKRPRDGGGWTKTVKVQTV